MVSSSQRKIGVTFRWVLISTSLFLSGCPEEPNRTTEPSPPADQVAAIPNKKLIQVPIQAQDRIRTEVVAERLAPRTVTAPGEVALDLNKVAKVSSRIAGQIDKILVQLGDRVHQGQPLVSIGSLKLDELVQEFLVSKAQADVAQKNFERTKRLLAEKVVSERRYLEDRGRYLEEKAVHQHVREKLLNMGLTKPELRELVQGKHIEGHRYILKAPLDGVISTQNVVLGEGVLPGEELFEIVDTSRVWVFANLPIEQVQRFKQGNRGQVVAKGREPIEARLTFISPVADKATLTVRLRFDVSNPNGHLKPNEYVEVQLFDESSFVLAIPVSALTFVEGHRGVFVKREQGYVFMPVELGLEGNGWIEVKKGLMAGEEVVTKGVFDLKNALLKESIQGD